MPVSTPIPSASMTLSQLPTTGGDGIRVSFAQDWSSRQGEPANRQPAPACSGLADRQGRSHPGVPGACRRQDAAVAAWVDSQDHEVDQRPDDLVEVTSLMLDAARPGHGSFYRDRLPRAGSPRDGPGRDERVTRGQIGKTHMRWR